MFDFPNSPTNGQLVTMPDGTVRMWDGVKWVAGASSATSAVVVSDTAPASPNNGQLWWDSSGTQLYLWYQDPSSNQWVPASNASTGGTIVVSDTAPSSPQSGSLWWDSTGGQLYLWYVDQNTSQWVPASNQSGALAEAPTDGGVYARQSGGWVATGAQVNIGRNKLHNPLFNIAQRGGGPWTTNSAYTLDRWAIILVLDTVSVSQIALTDTDRTQIGDEEANYALQNQFTGNAGATAYSEIYQRIENVRRLANKTVTLSFWARAVSGTPKLGLNILQYFGSGGSPSASVRALATGNAVTLSTTWTRYSTTIAVPSIVGKTLGSNNDHSTQLEFFFSSGANANAVAGNIGVQTATIQIWGVQLEVGSVATPLEKPDQRYDLANCQRFYFTATVFATGYGTAGTTIYGPYFWPVQMRAAPAIAYSGQSYVNASALATYQSYANSYVVQGTVSGTGTAIAAGTMTASADL